MFRAGLFSWLSSIGKVDDSNLLRMVGMDHYVLLRHCLLGVKITLMSVFFYASYALNLLYYCQYMGVKITLMSVFFMHLMRSISCTVSIP